MASRSGAPEPEETVAFLDLVMLDPMGHTSCHDDHAATHEAVNNDDTAAAVHTSSGHSCYFSFALAAPPKVSYLTVHWPELSADESGLHLPAYPYVLAADNNLVLLRVAIRSNPHLNYAPSDLFVYAASPPPSSPSVMRLPVPDEPAKDLVHKRAFLASYSAIGILRLAAAVEGDQDRGYIIADLDVSAKKNRNRHQACHQSNGGQFPTRWSTNDVLPLGGRFLCWVDYFRGLLLSDFSKVNSPALHFVPFPGKQYAYDNIREPTRSFGGTFRSVSVSQGRIRFVHIDNDFHDKDEWNRCSDCSERKRRKLGTKITIWTLKNMMDGGGSLRFEWEVHRVINLECLWAQIGYQDQGLPRHLPEFPVIAADDPDVLCCVLREEYRGKEWMIMVDMKYAYLRSSTPCVNEKPNSINSFGYVPLVPSVISKYLQRPNAGN
ncbi:hypothetical protein ACQ4PT_002067 [Festuca glaucescens]